MKNNRLVRLLPLATSTWVQGQNGLCLSSLSLRSQSTKKKTGIKKQAAPVFGTFY